MSTLKKPSRLSHLKDSSSKAIQKTSTEEMGEILSKRYVNISVYTVLMLCMAIAIIWTSVITAEQVQQHHLDYRALQDMRAQYQRLQIEHQRLLIEQQTFSATPQIASRAVTELGMYSPTTKDKWILQPAVSPNYAATHSTSRHPTNTNVNPNTTREANDKVATSYITTKEVTP